MFTQFASDSLATCNLYRKTNIYMHSQTTRMLCVRVCVLSAHQQTTAAAVCPPWQLAQTGHLSAQVLRPALLQRLYFAV